MRRLGHAFIAHDGDESLLRSVAGAADRVAADLETAPRRERDLVELKRRTFEAGRAGGGRLSHFDECFVSGPHNPMGIAMHVTREGDEAVARVSLGAAFEGAPRRAHGGIVAAIFDDVMGYLLSFLAVPAFTGELTVRYLAATPVGVPLTYRARVTGREGRKITASADAAIDHDGALVAAARATFITVDPDRFRAS